MLLVIDGGTLAYPRYKAGNLVRYSLEKVETLDSLWKPDKTIVAWDRFDNCKFRREMYPEYKANRPPKEQEYLEQLMELQSVLPDFGIEQYEGPGEADDVIYTLANLHCDEHEIVAYSADKDLIQIIDIDITLLKAGVRGNADMHLTIENLGDIEINFNGCKVKGLTPDDWTVLLALAGDSVDNIPGVPLIGPKKAMHAIKKYPKFIDQLKFGMTPEVIDDDKVMTRIFDNRELFMTSLRLVELYDIPLTHVESKYNHDEVQKMHEEYEMYKENQNE